MLSLSCYNKLKSKILWKYLFNTDFGAFGRLLIFDDDDG